MFISPKSLFTTWCMGLALLLGVASSARADTYNYYITDYASFANMTPTGGPILGHFVSGNLPVPDHSFLLEVTVSPITSLVPGNVYEWHNPVLGGLIEAVGMHGPANIYDDLPLKNLQPIPIVINGIEISDNPALWMTER